MAISILLLAAATHALSAQAAVVIAPPGSLMGFVDDSLHGVPLGGSVVTAISLDSQHVRKSAVVDSVGAYRISGLAAGAYRVEVSHPLLDSMDVTLVAPSVTVIADRPAAVRLAIPSRAALIRGWCGDSLANDAVVIGAIVDERGMPLRNAIVRMEWIDLSNVAAHSGPKAVVANAGSDERGRYVLCGAPTRESEVLASLWIYVDSAHQLMIPYHAAENGVLVQMIRMATLVSRPDLPVTTPTERGVVAGSLLHADGTGARGAQVVMVLADGRSWRADADSTGRFELRGIPPGTYPLRARQLGYAVVDTAVNVQAGTQSMSPIVLTPVSTQLASVHIVRSLDRTGFDHRREAGSGYYVTAEDIAKSHAPSFSAVLRLSPALHVSDARGGPYITATAVNPFSGTYKCATIWIDGRRMRSDEKDMYPEASDIAGMESYRPNNGPAEFDSGCALVLIWTKGYRAPNR